MGLSLFDLVYFKELKTRTENCASYRSPMTTTKEKTNWVLLTENQVF